MSDRLKPFTVFRFVCSRSFQKSVSAGAADAADAGDAADAADADGIVELRR